MTLEEELKRLEDEAKCRIEELKYDTRLVSATFEHDRCVRILSLTQALLEAREVLHFYASDENRYTGKLMIYDGEYFNEPSKITFDCGHMAKKWLEKYG